MNITRVKESAMTVTRQIIAGVLSIIFYINPFIVSVVDEGLDNTLTLSTHIYEGGLDDSLITYGLVEDGGFDTI